MLFQEENEDSAADRVLIDVAAKGKQGLLRRYRRENRREFEELLNKRVSGWTPATMAVFYRFQPCLEYIAECGADLLLSRNPVDHTPLIVACLRGDLAMVHYLVCEAYVDVNQCSTTRNGFSPLMAACQIGHIEVVTLLLSNGADIHHRGENARTAIFYSALSGCVHCMRALLLRGADVNLLDHRGHSPLLATLFFADHAAVVALLLRGGAQVNLVDRDGYSPLLVAVLFRSSRVVALLLTQAQPRLDLYLPIPPTFATVLTAAHVTADGATAAAAAERPPMGDDGDDASPSPADTPHRRLWRYYVEDERGDEDITAAFRAYCHVQDEWAAKEATRRLQQTERRARRTMVDEPSASAFFGYECRIA